MLNVITNVQLENIDFLSISKLKWHYLEMASENYNNKCDDDDKELGLNSGNHENSCIKCY